MHNPFSRWRVTGSWENHASYSEGGTDYPTPYGTRIPAPASGRLRYDGWRGTAGRRATLLLDTPVKRVRPRSRTRMLGGTTEAEGPMVAIVFQHLAAAPREGAYTEGDADMIRTGASASGNDWGAQVHCHVHGLDSAGRRLDFTKFVGSSTAGGETVPIEEKREATMTTLYRDTSTDVNGKSVDGTTVFAYAGDGIGQAGWIETRDYSLAVHWAKNTIYGTSIPLSHATFESFRARYQGGITVTGGSDTAALVAAIREAFPSKVQLEGNLS